MTKDPVCGMEVDPKAATEFSEYDGQKYYFCSVSCKETFEADPEPFIAGSAA